MFFLLAISVLFYVLGLLRFLVISVFSLRHSRQVFIPGLYLGHSRFNSHFTDGAGLALLSQICLDSVVLLFSSMKV